MSIISKVFKSINDLEKVIQYAAECNIIHYHRLVIEGFHIVVELLVNGENNISQDDFNYIKDYINYVDFVVKTYIN